MFDYQSVTSFGEAHQHTWQGQLFDKPRVLMLNSTWDVKQCGQQKNGQDWGLSRNGRMNVSGRLISLRRRSVLWLWYICGLAWSKTNFWKNQSEKWTLCGLHAFRPFPLFHFFHFFGESGFYNLCKPWMKPLIEVCVYVPWGRVIL